MAQHPLDTVRALAEKYPQAEKAFLFGDHEVYRVKKKVFVWLGDGETADSTYVSVKLKDTQHFALTLPFVKPSEYGMAKWGWINADFPKGKFAGDLVRQWIDESYRHTAPKKLLALLDGGGTPPAAAPEKKSTAKKNAGKKSAAKRVRR
jgi:predicted DNA-binding protein (MmcQ/YjbR family)